MQPYAVIFVLAFLAESLTEYLARPILEALPGRTGAEGEASPPSPLWLRYVAALVGIGLAIAYRADLLGLMGFAAVSPWIGYVVTGILCGRGSNCLHDLIDRLRPEGV